MITETVARFQNSPSTELQQRAYEFAELVKVFLISSLKLFTIDTFIIRESFAKRQI